MSDNPNADIEAKYVAAAREKQKDGELEVDEGAKVFFGDDPGAYVQVWIWITAEEAGVQETAQCDDCRIMYAPNSDGWLGLCPDCADKSEGDEE